jgi:hypothetical protein
VSYTSTPGQLHAPAALASGKEPSVFVEPEAEWTPRPVWMLWRREKYVFAAGNRTPLSRLANPVEQSPRRLSYFDHTVKMDQNTNSHTALEDNKSKQKKIHGTRPSSQFVVYIQEILFSSSNVH